MFKFSTLRYSKLIEFLIAPRLYISTDRYLYAIWFQQVNLNRFTPNTLNWGSVRRPWKMSSNGCITMNVSENGMVPKNGITLKHTTNKNIICEPLSKQHYFAVHDSVPARTNGIISMNDRNVEHVDKQNGVITNKNGIIKTAESGAEGEPYKLGSFLDDTSLDTKLARKLFVQRLLESPYVDTYQPPHQNGPDCILPSTTRQSCDPSHPVVLPIENEGAASAKPVSLVTFLQRLKTKFSSAVALQVERDEELFQWTYEDFWNDARNAAKGFLKLGLERFHAVGILGFNAPEWIISSMGAAFAGGIPAGIYTTNSSEACRHVLRDSKADIVVVENDMQLKKILNIREELPHLKAIIQYVGEPCTSGILSWNDLIEIGRGVPDEHLEKRIKSLAVNQCCSLIYTSGTTGPPNGVMLNHDNITYLCQRFQSVAHTRDATEVYVSFLPLSHVAAQMAEYMVYACAGKIHFAPPDALKGNLVETLKKVKPSFILGVPRVWEKMSEKLKEAERELSSLKKALFRWANSQAVQYNQTKKTESDGCSIFFSIAKRMVLNKIHRALGFEKIQSIVSGAAPLSTTVLNHFIGLNLPITECYGMSETSGPHTYNSGLPMKIGSVGKPFPGFDIKINSPDSDGNGEICLRGRNIFMGYLGNKDKTLETLDDDGWLYTGDVGYLTDDNYLYVTGRIKEILITAGGENVAPLTIEEQVKQVIPVVSNCMLIGDRRKFLSLLVTLKTDFDMDTLLPKDSLTAQAKKWCRSIGSTAETVNDILHGPDGKVMSAIQDGINRVNQKAISNAQRIQKWVILSQDFSIPGGEVGPTMKLKRKAVSNIHSEKIELIYKET